jgi:hypothetical protein
MIAAGKNVIVNGAMDYNQRNAGAVSTGFICDRFYVIGFAGTGTWQRVALAANSFADQVARFAIRITSTSASNDFCIGQNIEDVTTFAGQEVTISLWARTDSITAGWDLAMISQNFGVGGSATVSTFFNTTGKVFGPTWTKLTFTGTLPSVAGKTIGAENKLEFRIDPLTVVANGAWVEVTQIQVERGSEATPFTRAGGTIGGELSVCQRYYTRIGGDTAYGIIAPGIATNTNSAAFIVNLPTPMRAAPTSSDYSTLGVTDLIAVNTAITSLAIVATETTRYSVRLDVGASGGGLTQFRTTFLRNFNSSAAYVGFSADI